MEIDRALENAARAQATANAFITLRNRDELIAEARRPGPLDGVLLSVKDDLFTADLRTTGGSRAFADFVPRKDAPAVALLREAGATVLGKTNLSEFAMSLEEGS
ncbi:amidase family protein, partial [Rhizobiaceae sp. 2RAB30]